ncbi:ArnT family glycosyltransferase [Dyadobacter luticola]|uniref:Glycosyltransferase RgtA/B/C/D-like domain-containing protein n=1 Tax=Dyadobacter luticola TaxID=1979387 RepID=A0A5R9KT89_9BACT|nr:glycosyltransferase family 39 protein [Dyadobacter luticola]TLU99420.1 hypothetical protein FEN17_22955 [Dyadobacter luticola]
MLPKDFSRIITWGLIGSFLVYFTGWLVALRDEHAARYATMALDMARSGNFFQFDDPLLFFQKANLPLWLSAISIQIFGPNHLAYRLPGLLPAILSLYAVYRFSKLYYNTETSLLAVLILATAESSFMLNHDLSVETYQAAFYMFMIWQQAEYLHHKKWQNLLLCIMGGILLIFSRGTLPGPQSQFAPLEPLIQTLWTFAPWTIFLFAGLWSRIREVLVSGKMDRKPEQMSLFGFLVPFILLSLSPYHSDHDVFVAFPLAAVVASEFIFTRIYQAQRNGNKMLSNIQIAFLYLMLAVLFCLVWFPFPDNNYYGMLHYMALFGIVSWLIFFSGPKFRLLLASVIVAIGANLILNIFFYSNLADYQAGSKLGALARTDGVKAGRLFSYHAPETTLLHFYSGTKVQTNSDFENLAALKNCWIYTNQAYLEQFRAVRPDLKIIGRSAEYDHSKPLIRFLNPETREKAVSKMVLIRL